MQTNNGDRKLQTMNIRNLLAGVATLMLIACVSITEVVPAGKDTYVVAGDDAWEGTSGASTKLPFIKRQMHTAKRWARSFYLLTNLYLHLRRSFVFVV